MSNWMSMGWFFFVLQGYYFYIENFFKDWFGVFEEGLKRLKEGDLLVIILFMEVAIFQDFGDVEVFFFFYFVRFRKWLYVLMRDRTGQSFIGLFFY